LCNNIIASGSRSYQSKRFEKRLKDLFLATESTEFTEKRREKHYLYVFNTFERLFLNSVSIMPSQYCKTKIHVTTENTKFTKEKRERKKHSFFYLKINL